MSRVVEYAKTVPWAILPEALETVLAIAEREFGDPASIERMLGERQEGTQRTRIRDGVAIIPVRGPIFRYANLFTQISGATSSEVLANDIGAALADRKVRAIILEVDSPGGMVNGTAELSELIFRARGEKPIASFVSGLGASAAFYIASGAEMVFADRQALLGSIGTVLGVTDFRKADEKAGIRTMEFVSAQSPKKRLDPFDDDEAKASEARSELQRLVDDLAAVFIADVARNRGVSIDTVLSDFGQGGVLVGEAAVQAGLADGVTTLETLIAELSQDRRPRGDVGLRPAAAAAQTPRVANPSMEGVMPDSEKTAAAPAPTIDRAHLEENHADLVATFRTEGATKERERILAIQKLHGPTELKAECVADPQVSAGEAAIRLNAAVKAADEARGKAHLEDRATAEASTDAPSPGPAATTDGDDRARAKRVVALYNQLKGRAAPVATA